MTQTSAAANRHPRRGILAAGAALVLLVAACTSDPGTPQAAPPSPSPAAAPTPTKTGPDDAAGARACKLAQQLSLDSAPVPAQTIVDQLGQAAEQSTNFDIRFHGVMIGKRYALASAAAATNGSDQFTTRLGLTTAALEMVTACTKAGYPTT